jgi:hypothetical protein
MVLAADVSEGQRPFSNSIFPRSLVVANSRASAYLTSMANGLMPLAGLCALLLVCFGCGSDHNPFASPGAGAAATGAAGSAVEPEGGEASASAGTADRGGMTGAGGAAASAGGTTAATGSAGRPAAGESGDPPPAVDGQSVYALECHGDSKDCNLASVPCFGVGSPTPNVAAGWACANRCSSNADCSDAPSGAEAQASCAPFTSASHCVLVCRNESQTFACPDGMTCYVPAKSPLGYCLWQ